MEHDTLFGTCQLVKWSNKTNDWIGYVTGHIMKYCLIIVIWLVIWYNIGHIVGCMYYYREWLCCGHENWTKSFLPMCWSYCWSYNIILVISLVICDQPYKSLVILWVYTMNSPKLDIYWSYGIGHNYMTNYLIVMERGANAGSWASVRTLTPMGCSPYVN